MATYTGLSDANGNFTIPFTQNYTGGQKVIVKSSKDGAEKSIDLYAPSSVVGGGIITWTGTTVNFPRNIGVVTIGSEVDGDIAQFAFSASVQSFGYHATGLVIDNSKNILDRAFSGWVNSKSLVLPITLITIGVASFQGWNSALSLVIPNSVKTIGNDAFITWNSSKSLTLGSGVTSIGSYAFSSWASLVDMVVLPLSPPIIQNNTFQGINSSCVIKVPSSSLSSYQTAPNWSAHASKMVGV